MKFLLGSLGSLLSSELLREPLFISQESILNSNASESHGDCEASQDSQNWQIEIHQNERNTHSLDIISYC